MLLDIMTALPAAPSDLARFSVHSLYNVSAAKVLLFFEIPKGTTPDGLR